MSGSDAVALEALAGRIRQAHDLVVRSAKDTLTYARQAGGLLLSAKKEVPHGQWLQWLSSNAPFSVRTAQAYMRVVERWPEIEAKYAEPAHLTVEATLEHLAEPRESVPCVESMLKDPTEERSTSVETSGETADIASTSGPPARRNRTTRLSAEQRAVAREVRASIERQRAEAPSAVCKYCGQPLPPLSTLVETK